MPRAARARLRAGGPAPADLPQSGGQLPVAPPGRAAQVEPGHRRQAPGGGAARTTRPFRKYSDAGGRRDPRRVQPPRRCWSWCRRADARSRSRRWSRARSIVTALRHRRDVLRLHQRRGARDAGHRDEPARRPQSNSGEGGEESRRYVPDANGDLRRSAIKQVASARFGVTAEYLVNADELQIKIAQGAKPGEGGQLPGPQGGRAHRQGALVHAGRDAHLPAAAPRHLLASRTCRSSSTTSSRSTRRRAVSVKLVSEVGVGTIAAGVAKAGAGCVVIAGYEGGTGASPLSSIKHAGLPWELGLAETQQVLVQNGLRGRIRLQVDGGLRTARDVVVAALLGRRGVRHGHRVASSRWAASCCASATSTPARWASPRRTRSCASTSRARPRTW